VEPLRQEDVMELRGPDENPDVHTAVAGVLMERVRIDNTSM
jgi:hypothetical protein